MWEEQEVGSRKQGAGTKQKAGKERAENGMQQGSGNWEKKGKFRYRV